MESGKESSISLAKRDPSASQIRSDLNPKRDKPNNPLIFLYPHPWRRFMSHPLNNDPCLTSPTDLACHQRQTEKRLDRNRALSVHRFQTTFSALFLVFPHCLRFVIPGGAHVGLILVQSGCFSYATTTVYRHGRFRGCSISWLIGEGKDIRGDRIHVLYCMFFDANGCFIVLP